VVFSCRPRNSVNTPSRNLPFLIFSSRSSMSNRWKSPPAFSDAAADIFRLQPAANECNEATLTALFASHSATAKDRYVLRFFTLIFRHRQHLRVQHDIIALLQERFVCTPASSCSTYFLFTVEFSAGEMGVVQGRRQGFRPPRAGAPGVLTGATLLQALVFLQCSGRDNLMIIDL